jgi:malonate transporter and related proteins
VFVIGKVLPLFLVMLAGAGLARARILDEAGVAGLSRYVYWLGFPLLLVHSLGSAERPSAGVLIGLAGYAAGALGPLVLAVAAARLFRWREGARAALPMCAALGNTGFLGLPLAASLFGSRAIGWAGAVVGVDWVLLAGLSGALLNGESHPPHRAAAKGVFTPIVAGAVLGALQMAFQWRWPAPLDAAVSAVSASATAVGLVALGAVLAARPGGARPSRAGDAQAVWFAIGAKLLAGPACVALATTLLGAPAAFRATAVVMAACPTAVTVFIQARTAGVFAEGSARVVALSTLLSAISLTLIASLVAHPAG